MTTSHFDVRLRNGTTIVSLGETYAYGATPLEAMRMLYRSAPFDDRAVIVACAKGAGPFLGWVDGICKEKTKTKP
jgi:hypothetical protein